MIRSLLTRYQKDCETNEKHADPKLKTHYYKGSFQQMFETVANFLQKDSRYTVNHISKDHGEISVQLAGNNSCFIVITLIAVKPFEIAVDVHISTEQFSLFGNYSMLTNEVATFYEKLNKVATLINTGRNT